MIESVCVYIIMFAMLIGAFRLLGFPRGKK
jgi:hypothetical protein